MAGGHRASFDRGRFGSAARLMVNGLPTRVEVRGDGPPLLLIMGIWGEVAAWDPLLDELRGFQSIAFDAPGIGDTDMPRFPQSLPALARFAAGVLDAVGVARAHVLGYSLGGMVAQQLAVMMPHRVDRLVLASTSAGLLHVPGQPTALLRLMTPWLTFSDRGVQSAGRVFGGRIRREPHLVSLLGLCVPTSFAAYLNRLSALSGWWGAPWSIRQPALVLTGDDDPLVPPSNSRILAACLRNSRLHIVRGGGHLVLFDSPGEVAPVISSFLRHEHRRWDEPPTVESLVS